MDIPMYRGAYEFYVEYNFPVFGQIKNPSHFEWLKFLWRFHFSSMFTSGRWCEAVSFLSFSLPYQLSGVVKGPSLLFEKSWGRRPWKYVWSFQGRGRGCHKPAYLTSCCCGYQAMHQEVLNLVNVKSIFLAINEWGWVGYEELIRSRRVLSTEAELSCESRIH